MKTSIALSAGFCLAVLASPACAQKPTNEGRGYGGPLYVGPNFQQGGQHAPPTYGTKPVKKSVPVAKPERDAVQARKPPVKKQVDKETDTAKAAPVDTPSTPVQDQGPNDQGPNNQESSATTETASTTTCKKFDSTAGQTITVPCQ
jgi:hypothetical protein